MSLSDNVTYASNEMEIEPIGDRATVSLRSLAHVIYKRKWLVLFAFLGSAATASTVIMQRSAKPVYQATSQILVSPAREQVLDPKRDGVVPPWSGFNAVEQTAWVREMLTGRFLAERVVKALGHSLLYPEEHGPQHQSIPWFTAKQEIRDKALLEENAINNFLRSVSAEPAGRSSIVNLSFRHHDPAVAARVVNLLGEMYVERHLGVQKDPKTEAFFQEQFDVLKRKVTQSEEELLAFKQRHGISGSVKQEQELVLEQMNELRREMTATQGKQAEVQSRDAELRRQLALTARSSGTVTQLRGKLTELELQEQQLAVRLTDQNPMLRDVRNQILPLRERISKLEKASLYGNESSQESLYATLQTELLRTEAENKAARARQETQAAKLAELQTRLDALERVQIEFDRVEKQLQQDEGNHRLYHAKFEESRLSNAMDAQKIAGVRVIEPAHAPLLPIASKRRTKILLGILASAIGAIVLAFAVQAVGGSLDTAEDVQRALDLPVLASVPRLKRRAQVVFYGN